MGMINLIFSYLSNLNLDILNSCSKFNIIDILFITTTLFSFGNLFPFNILLVFLITQAYNKDSSNIFKSFTETSFEYYTKKSMNNDINTKCNRKEHPKEDDNDFCNNKINSE